MISKNQLMEIASIFSANEILEYVNLNRYDYLFFIFDLLYEDDINDKFNYIEEIEKYISVLGGVE